MPLTTPWQPFDGKPFFRKARLELALLRLHGVQMRRRGNDTELAIPYAPGEPFPLTEFFRFARVRRYCGQYYVLYAFDEKRNPVFCKN